MKMSRKFKLPRKLKVITQKKVKLIILAKADTKLEKPVNIKTKKNTKHHRKYSLDIEGKHRLR